MKKIIITALSALTIFGFGFLASAYAPAAPVNTKATSTSPTSINLSWDASAGAAGYEIYRNSTTTPIATTSANNYTDAGLVAATFYAYYLSAHDASGTKSVLTNAFSATTLATTTVADTTGPSAPTGLIATPISSSQINLAWTASADNVGVAGYRVFRDGAQIATTTHVYYTNTGLTATTSYTYNISAFDAAGNTSAASVGMTVSTFGIGQTITTNVTITIINGDKRGKLINYRSNEIIKVAVFSTADFSAKTIINKSVLFGGAQAIGWRMQDVNKDGLLDRVYSFRAKHLERLNAEENILTFSATTSDGKAIYSAATVRVHNGPDKFRAAIEKKIKELQDKINVLRQKLNGLSTIFSKDMKEVKQEAKGVKEDFKSGKQHKK